MRAQFHTAFMKAAARVIYRGSWETERPAIMKKYGWEKSNSEVLISTPRRFVRSSALERAPLAARPEMRHPCHTGKDLQYRNILCLSLTCLRPGDCGFFSSKARFPKTSGKDRRICQTGRGREAHLRVQPGGVPYQRVRWEEVAHSIVPVQSRGACRCDSNRLRVAERRRRRATRRGPGARRG